MGLFDFISGKEKYDFDTLPNRRGTKSLKWDVGENELPMWVADMDFAVAPEIIEALQKRLNERVLGYSLVDDEWRSAYQGWWLARHDYEIQKEWLIYAGGTLPAIDSIIRKLTSPAENVLLMSPVYNCFYYCIKNAARVPLQNELAYAGGDYSIDWADLEAKLADPQTTLFILCNPHNPVGRTFSRDDLSRIGELCEKHGVTVLSDEVHCDLTEPGVRYTPFAAASETCEKISASIIAPTKAFNIAGLQSAAIFAADKRLRHKISKALNSDDIAEPNFFGVQGAIAAFTKGAPWLDALREYLSENRKFATEFIARELPQVHVVPQDATYLMWLDAGAYTQDSAELARFIREKTGLYLSCGAQYGKGGEKFLRLNIATSRALLKDGLGRLKEALKICPH